MTTKNQSRRSRGFRPRFEVVEPRIVCDGYGLPVVLPFSSSLESGYCTSDPTFDTGELEPDGLTAVPGYNVVVGQRVTLQVLADREIDHADWDVMNAVDLASNYTPSAATTVGVGVFHHIGVGAFDDAVSFYAGDRVGKFYQSVAVTLKNDDGTTVMVPVDFVLSVTAPSGTLHLEAGSYQFDYLDEAGKLSNIVDGVNLGFAQVEPERFTASCTNPTNTQFQFGIVETGVTDLTFVYSDGEVIRRQWGNLPNAFGRSRAYLDWSGPSIYLGNYARVVSPNTSRVLPDASTPSAWGDMGDPQPNGAIEVSHSAGISPVNLPQIEDVAYNGNPPTPYLVRVIGDMTFKTQLVATANAVGGIPIVVSTIDWFIHVSMAAPTTGVGLITQAQRPVNWAGVVAGPPSQDGDHAYTFLDWARNIDYYRLLPGASNSYPLYV